MMLLIKAKKFVKIKQKFFLYTICHFLGKIKKFFWGDPLGHPKGPQRAYLGTLGPP